MYYIKTIIFCQVFIVEKPTFEVGFFVLDFIILLQVG